MNKFWRSKISIEKYKSLVSHSNVEKVNDARQNGENNMKRKERDMSSNAKIDMGENWPMDLVALLEPVPLIFLRLVLF